MDVVSKYAKFREFLGRLVQSANNRGFPLPQPKRYDQWDDTHPDYIREKLTFYAQYNCEFIVFFTKDKMDPVHHTMKFLEVHNWPISMCSMRFDFCASLHFRRSSKL